MNLFSLLSFEEYISKFQLELLSTEWVEFTWSCNFSSPLELPSEYELQVEANLNELLRDVREFIRTLLDEEMEVDSAGTSRDSDSPTKSLNRSVNQVNLKALLCLLSTFISQYNQTPETEDGGEANQRAVESARLYFALISVEGAYIYQIYHDVIFSNCLEIFKTLSTANPLMKCTSKSRRRKNTAVDNANGECEQENGVSVNPDDIAKQVTYCCDLIDELHCCLKRFPLSSDPVTLNLIINTMIQTANVERKDALFLNRHPKNYTPAYLAFKAYSILEDLCQDFHGDVSTTLKDMMRSLVSCLSIYEMPNWQQVSQEIIVVKNHTVHFIIKIINLINEKSYESVYTLVQHLCMRVPDKADIRLKCVDIIIDLVCRFPSDLYYRILLFICSLCCSDAVKVRILGIELIGKFISFPPKEDVYDESDSTSSSTSAQKQSSENGSGSQPDNTNQTSNYHIFLNHEFLFSLIISRCKDISPRIRMKSLSIFSSLLRSRDIFIHAIVEELFIFNIDNEIKEIFDFGKFFRKKLYSKPENINTHLTAGSIIKLIERLAQDAKALVRKNALHVISDICMLHDRWLTGERLNILVCACKDLSVGNRKLMAQCLTDQLVQNPDSELVINSWVDGVVPLFAENEVKSQEKVLELASSIILDNVVPCSKARSSKHCLPWKIIASISHKGMRKLFRFACKQWCLKACIKDNFIKHLLSYLGSDNNYAAWFFLVCISEFMDLPNPEIIAKYFYEKVFRNKDVNELESQLVMQALLLNWRNLKKPEIVELTENLRMSLEIYETPLPLISGSMDIIYLNDPARTKIWAQQMLQSGQKRIMQRVFRIMTEEVYSDALLCRYIFTLGEASQIYPDCVNKETIKALTNLIDFANIQSENIVGLEKSLSHFGNVHAVTVCTLGKLCLQDQFTAKAVVPILGALVSAKTPSSIKNNATIALTDLCIRFSSLVEPFFGDMFVCLKDSDPIVRKNTLMLLARLIQEQYLKLRTHIFIYLLSMLRDPSSEIRDFTSSFLVNSLMVKDENTAFAHFIQGIFFMNGYGGVIEQVSPQEKAMFCLIGEECCAARRELYIFLLQNMNDVLKFKTKFRICIEVLNAIAEGTIPLEEKGVAILKDALFILGCDEIKIASKKGGKDVEEDDEFSEPVAIVKKNIMNQIASSIAKKNLIDNVIPIIKSLRLKLQSIKSPLVVDVMICLREILKDFDKSQVEEILAADPDLAAEVLYELNREEEVEETVPQPQEEIVSPSSKDVVMNHMEEVARNITCKVMLHGPESISQGNGILENATDDPPPVNETPKQIRGKRRSSNRGPSKIAKLDTSASKAVDMQVDNSGNCSPSTSISSAVSSLSSRSSSSSGYTPVKGRKKKEKKKK